MSDLINRQDVINAVNKYYNDHKYIKRSRTILSAICTDMKNGIEGLPSAEHKRGKWIFNPSDAIEAMFTKPKCSECGFESADGENYCPKCGARMGEREEE